MAKNVVINGVTYSDVPSVEIPLSGGGDAEFHDISGADAVAANVLNGKKFGGASGMDTGSMPNNGAVSGEIETKSGTITVQAGYTSGGSVGIKASAVADLTSGNLLAGTEVLGVQGGLTVPTVSQDSTTKVLRIS